MSVFPVPQIVYNPGSGDVTINLTHPSKAYSYGSMGVGGQDVSASGIPEAFETRRDQLLYWTLVFLESEWASIEAWLNWAQRFAGSFTIAPSKATPSTKYTVYLENPKMGQEIKPNRTSGYVGAFQIELTFRRTTSTRFDSPIL